MNYTVTHFTQSDGLQNRDFSQTGGCKGIMIHSTATPGAMKDRMYAYFNVRKRGASVNGILDDTGVYETLPLTKTSGHCGGEGNRRMLSIEICEPNPREDAQWFSRMYRDQLIPLLAKWLAFHGLNNTPLSPQVLTCHAEGHRRGIASNHGDVEHWFPQMLGVSDRQTVMDVVRRDVAAYLAQNADGQNPEAPAQTPMEHGTCALCPGGHCPTCASQNKPDKDGEVRLITMGSGDEIPGQGAGRCPAVFLLTRLLALRKPQLKGEDVKWMQTALIERGYSCGVTRADGIYGPRTQSAVRLFQTSAGLACDGMVGKHTITALGGAWAG